MTIALSLGVSTEMKEIRTLWPLKRNLFLTDGLETWAWIDAFANTSFHLIKRTERKKKLGSVKYWRYSMFKTKKSNTVAYTWFLRLYTPIIFSFPKHVSFFGGCCEHPLVFPLGHCVSMLKGQCGNPPKWQRTFFFLLSQGFVTFVRSLRALLDRNGSSSWKEVCTVCTFFGFYTRNLINTASRVKVQS